MRRLTFSRMQSPTPFELDNDPVTKIQISPMGRVATPAGYVELCRQSDNVNYKGLIVSATGVVAKLVPSANK